MEQADPPPFWPPKIMSTWFAESTAASWEKANPGFGAVPRFVHVGVPASKPFAFEKLEEWIITRTIGRKEADGTWTPLPFHPLIDAP